MLAFAVVVLLQAQAPEPAAPVDLGSSVEPTRPRLQFEFGLGHGLAWGTAHAVAPGVAQPIGGATHFQQYGTVDGGHAEIHVLVADVNLRIGEWLRVGARLSSPLMFVEDGELLARVGFEPPVFAHRGELIDLRSDGPHVSVVPVLWLGTGYAIASNGLGSNGFGRPGWAFDATAALEVRWKYGFIQAEVGYRALLNWRMNVSSDSESNPVRFTSPAYIDAIRLGVSGGVRFRAF